jgi:serine/threonine protein kinase
MDLSICDTMRLSGELLERELQSAKRIKQELQAGHNAVEVSHENRASMQARPTDRGPDFRGGSHISNIPASVRGQPSVSLDETLEELRGAFGHFLRERNRVVTVNDNKYLRLGVLGKGGSTTVHRVMSRDGELFAFKCVEMNGAEDECAALLRSYANEIELLTRLRGSPYIIELIESEVDWQAFTVSMVMEVGDTDLAKVLSGHKRADHVGPFFTRTVWHDMLRSVDFIHQNRGMHSSISRSNLYSSLVKQSYIRTLSQLILSS